MELFFRLFVIPTVLLLRERRVFLAFGELFLLLRDINIDKNLFLAYLFGKKNRPS